MLFICIYPYHHVYSFGCPLFKDHMKPVPVEEFGAHVACMHEDSDKWFEVQGKCIIINYWEKLFIKMMCFLCDNLVNWEDSQTRRSLCSWNFTTEPCLWAPPIKFRRHTSLSRVWQKRNCAVWRWKICFGVGGGSPSTFSTNNTMYVATVPS